MPAAKKESMVLIKPFSWVGPWTGRGGTLRGAMHLVDHHSLLRGYISKSREPPISSARWGGKQRSRGKGWDGSMSLRARSRDPSPSGAALPAPSLRLHLFLLDPPESQSQGPRSKRTNLPRKEGRTQDWGTALDKDPLVPKAEWQEARAKPLHSQPMVPGYRAALGWMGKPPSLMSRALPHPCFYTRLSYYSSSQPTKSTPAAPHPDHLSRVTPHWPSSAKPQTHMPQ